jgi:prepilin-type N-terminal cleavage/methylation domain-containing protein
MRFACKKQRIASQRGLTLVELLVVVGVVSVLTAIVLPSIKTVLTDRKTSQSAIVVRNFLEAARARAVGSNRNIAVVLERISSRPFDRDNDGSITSADKLDGLLVSATAQTFDIVTRQNQPPELNFVPYNTCIQLSLAEQRPPINEKLFFLPTGHSFRMMCRRPLDALTGYIPIPVQVYTGPHELLDTNQRNSNPPVAEYRIFYVSELQPDSTWQKLEADGAELYQIADYLVAGNEIEFPGSSRRYTITAPLSREPHDVMIRNPDASGVRRLWFAISNQEPSAITNNDDDSLALCNPRLFSTPTQIPPDPPLGVVWPPHSRRPIAPSGGSFEQFKIHLAPKPIPGESIRLPKGMCIDLSISGLSGRGRSASDNRVLFASDWVLNPLSVPDPGIPHPTELRPVYLVFSPDGTISQTYSNREKTSYLARRDAVEDVFLHIGKIDQIVMARQGQVRDVAGLLNAIQAGQKMNLTDLSSFVVRISPKSGAINVAPQLSIQTQVELEAIRLGITPAEYLNRAVLGDLVELSRKATYNSEVSAQ